MILDLLETIGGACDELGSSIYIYINILLQINDRWDTNTLTYDMSLA